MSDRIRAFLVGQRRLPHIPEARQGRLALRPDFGRWLLAGRAYFALAVIVVAFSALSSNYLTVTNVLSMSSHVAIYALLAVGELLTILDAGIDLSVGSTLGLSGVVAGALLGGVHVAGFTLYPSVPVVVVLCCLVGAGVGLVNGLLIARFRIAPFIATLGTLYAIRGVALLQTSGLTYDNLGGSPDLGNTGFNWLGFNNAFGIPVGIWIMIGVALIVSFSLNFSVFGRWLYAAGGNERAAELSGVPVKKVTVRVYVVSGICAAIAGLILSSELTSAGPTAGSSYELTAIAAVVIGGASLFGGVGNVRGTLVGAFVIGFLSDGLVIIGVSAYWQTVFTGVVIVAAVMLNSVQYRHVRRPSNAGTGPSGAPSESTVGGATHTTKSSLATSPPASVERNPGS